MYQHTTDELSKTIINFRWIDVTYMHTEHGISECSSEIYTDRPAQCKAHTHLLPFPMTAADITHPSFLLNVTGATQSPPAEQSGPYLLNQEIQHPRDQNLVLGK